MTKRTKVEVSKDINNVNDLLYKACRLKVDQNIIDALNKRVAELNEELKTAENPEFYYVDHRLVVENGKNIKKVCLFRDTTSNYGFKTPKEAARDFIKNSKVYLRDYTAQVNRYINAIKQTNETIGSLNADKKTIQDMIDSNKFEIVNA